MQYRIVSIVFPHGHIVPSLVYRVKSATARRGRSLMSTIALFIFVMDACFLCCIIFNFSVLSQVFGWEERLWNDLFYVGGTSNLNSVNQSRCRVVKNESLATVNKGNKCFTKNVATRKTVRLWSLVNTCYPECFRDECHNAALYVSMPLPLLDILECYVCLWFIPNFPSL